MKGNAQISHIFVDPIPSGLSDPSRNFTIVRRVRYGFWRRIWNSLNGLPISHCTVYTGCSIAGISTSGEVDGQTVVQWDIDVSSHPEQIHLDVTT